MPPASNLAFFALAALALLAVPGPAVLYVVAQSVDHGRRAGLLAVAGVHLGTLVHIAAAAAGLSALLVSSATAFDAVRYAGAAYLIFLGLRRLLDRSARAAEEVHAPAHRRVFARGFVVNVLNPKTALFFLAFLPQFVEPDAAAVPLQVVVLGLTFAGLGLLSDGAYAIAAGGAAAWLRQRRGVASAERYVTGTVYLGLGAAAALGGPHRPHR